MPPEIGHSSSKSLTKMRPSVTKKRDESVVSRWTMMDLGSRRGGVTGPLLQSMGLRKMRHLVHVVGFACWEVLALGHGARGSERQVQMVSTKQNSTIDYNRHGGWMEVSSPTERKSEIGLHVPVEWIKQ